MFFKSNNMEDERLQNVEAFVEEVVSKIVNLPFDSEFTIGQFLPKEWSEKIKQECAEKVFHKIENYFNVVDKHDCIDKTTLVKPKDEICSRILKFIDENNAYKSIPAKKNDNLIEIGYIEYNKDFYSLLCLLHRTIGEDLKYNKNIENVKNKEISSLKVKEITTYLTFIVRGERFCEGHIASYIDNGILKKLILRVIEVC